MVCRQGITPVDADYTFSGGWAKIANVLLMPHFIQALVDAGRNDPSIGTVCGKLLIMSPDFDIGGRPQVDSTGLYFTPNLRHLDRGSREIDSGCYLKREYVFGATASAALYRREMIDDISVDGEFFDSDFFAYLEDADVAWRAQLLGWRCLYTPYARGYHVRAVLPGNRRALPRAIKMHSVKNRFLMRIKNMTGHLYGWCWLPITARDLVVLACCIMYEHYSLKAFVEIGRAWRGVWMKRRWIMERKRVSDDYIAAWIRYHPVSRPATNMGRDVATADSDTRVAEV